MFKKLNISTKITLLVLSVILLVVVVEVTISFIKKKELIHKIYRTELSIVCDVQEHNIKNHFSNIEKELLDLESSDLIHSYLRDTSQEGLIRKQIYKTLTLEVVQPFNDVYSFEDIYLLNTKGDVLYQYCEGDSVYSFPINSTLYDRKIGFYYNKVIEEHGHIYTYASIPIFDIHQKVIGLLGCKIDVQKLVSELIDPNLGFGNTGEILVGYQHGNKLAYIYSSIEKDPSKINSVASNDQPIYQATSNKSGFGEYIDHSGHKTLAIWKPISSLDLGIIIKVDRNEAYEAINSLYFLLIIKALITIAIALLLGYLFSRFLTRPIVSLKKSFDKIQKGDLPDAIPIESQDEISEIAKTVNSHVEVLKSTAAFARSIGKREFDFNFNPISDQDALGIALVEMKERLQEVDEKDTNHNWIVTGVAELASVLRSHNKITPLADAVCEYLYKRLDGRQVCIYLIDDDNSEKLNLTSAFAYGKKKFIEKSYQFGEKIVGEAAFEKATVYKTEVKDDYDFIPSGLKNDKLPESVITVPLITNEEIYGILEINSDNVLKKREIEYIEQVSDIIAQTVFSIKVNDNTKSLLDEIQHAQTRLHALLENSSEIITIADKEGTILYASPSVEHILGYQADDLIGTKDANRLDGAYLDKFESFLGDLSNSKKESKQLELKYKKKNGEKIWIEAIGMNLLEDPAIRGLVVNYRDITTRKLAEEEQRKRGQMQALSENSLDLITRISANGVFFYLNPMIHNLTGNKPDFFLNKSIDEVGLDEEAVTGYHEVVDQVLRERANVSIEINFKTHDEKKLIMLVNAIPEFNTENKIESVLVVSHDITERKQIEMEIQLKNKKINESINYAERIQSTILPDLNVIKEHIPNSFMFFKPRDLVSGDFPWYFQKGDNIYLAVVDCTGHGVPGAMISFVGYFLLNNAAKNNELSSPGVLMDTLDQAVTEAFRQNDEDSKIKDGMDMGLCRINIKTKEIEYAGAHRPLYLINTAGELTEIKGDRWPVGGGSAYRNKTNFTNTTINPKDGETIYFFSDGYPDQFGGPDNRKYGPKRMKALVSEHHQKSMPEIEALFENEFNTWQGNVKQTDDVLLFGIRF